MISTLLNPAFEFLRQHKQISQETEKLVMKKVRGRITQDELLTVFENGIAGQYGKLYSADPQTLISWVDQFEAGKNSIKNYLEAPLEPITTSDAADKDWMKEANKCYRAFLNGVSEKYFHHAVYMRMVLDDKIPIGALYKHCPFAEQVGWTEELKTAARKVLRDIFLHYKSRGFATVYFIK